MKRRYLLFALAYCLFLISLCLFPPFGDGRHHFYDWGIRARAELSDLGGRLVIPTFAETRISVGLLGIEAAVGLLAIFAIALLMVLFPDLRLAAVRVRRRILALGGERQN